MTAHGVPVLATVVEGRAEVRAVPVLLRRITQSFGRTANFPAPYRVDRAKMTRGEDLQRAVRTVSQRIAGAGGTIVLLDADDDCPLDLRTSLDRTLAHATLSAHVVVAHREFEAWFLASMSSLTRHLSVQHGASFVADPEGPRNAKKTLELNMTESYKEMLHQPGFSSMIDVELAAARSRSFRRLIDGVDVLTR